MGGEWHLLTPEGWQKVPNQSIFNRRLLVGQSAYPADFSAATYTKVASVKMRLVRWAILLSLPAIALWFVLLT